MCKTRSYKGGQVWRNTEDGWIETQDSEGRWYAPRSGGQPLTMRTLFDEHGEAMLNAARIFDIPVSWIAGMIPIEAKRISSSYRQEESDKYRMDTVSLRYEPGFNSQATTPNKVSSGLAQCLLSTMEDMKRRYPDVLTVSIGGTEVPLSTGDLMDPQRSCLFMASYMRYQVDRYEDDELTPGTLGCDFVLMTGAYNAGGVRFDEDNPYHLRTYSDSRTERAIEWHNDAIAVMAERGLE